MKPSRTAQLALIPAVALTTTLVTGCGGTTIKGCRTTPGLSGPIHGQILGTLTLECTEMPDRHSLSIYLQYRAKDIGPWRTVREKHDNDRHVRATFELRNRCVPGEWSLWVKQSGHFPKDPDPKSDEGRFKKRKITQC